MPSDSNKTSVKGGRPRFDASGRLEVLTVSLAPIDGAWLREEAWKQRTSASGIVREAVSRLRHEMELSGQ